MKLEKEKQKLNSKNITQIFFKNNLIIAAFNKTNSETLTILANDNNLESNYVYYIHLIKYRLNINGILLN